MNCSTCKTAITGMPRHRNGPAAWCSDGCYSARKVAPLKLTAPKVAKPKPLKIPAERESAIVGAILAVLCGPLYRGKVEAWRNNTGAGKLAGKAGSAGRFMRFGALGSADIFCVIGGRFLGLEVKAAKGKTSEAQEAWAAKIRAVGGVVVVVRSVVEARAAVDKIPGGES